MGSNSNGRCSPIEAPVFPEPSIHFPEAGLTIGGSLIEAHRVIDSRGSSRARSYDVIQHQKQKGPSGTAWMLSVPPHQAPGFEPQDIPAVEKMSNGDRFLAATTETFKVHNPVHLEAAQQTGRAIRPLNIGGGTVPEKPLGGALPAEIDPYFDGALAKTPPSWCRWSSRPRHPKGPLMLTIVVAVFVTISVLGIGGVMTEVGPWYQALRKPSWNPPNWIFGPAWTVILGLACWAGIAAWNTAPGPGSKLLVAGLFGANAIFHMLWSPLFFTWKRPDWALIEVPFLWASILALMIALAPFSPLSSWLLVPYFLWVSFAMFLNYTIVRLNAPFGVRAAPASKGLDGPSGAASV